MKHTKGPWIVDSKADIIRTQPVNGSYDIEAIKKAKGGA